MLWLGFGGTSGASSSKQLGSHCWGKRIIGTVPSTLCRLCIWLRESFHMHGCRICSVRLCVAVAFWYALWFLLLGVSSLCYVWMQIRARGWWTDRASMEGEDVYMWARCSRMFEDSICYILFSILFCVDVWYNLYDYYFCFELGVPHLYSFDNKTMFFSICLLKHTHKHSLNW